LNRLLEKVMGNYPHVFTPIKIGQMTVKNRIEFAPVGSLLALNGLMSRELIEWGRQFARGGAGIVTIGDSTTVLPDGVQGGPSLNLGTDRAVNPLNNFAEVIHRYGAKASVQLNYRTAHSLTEMTQDDIKKVIDSYAAAALRCCKAGMDMVMVHGAHGHMISQFISPRKNTRTDAYGGSLKNRARLVMEILEEIRNRVGNKLAVEYRISADELIPQGLVLEEQLEFARMIQDRVDLMHVSAGFLNVQDTLPRMFQPNYLPRGINVDFATQFKNALKIPVTTVGSLDMDMAEEIVKNNRADVVAMARTLIADPEAPNKAQRSQTDQIRPCVRCNKCIDRTHSYQLPVHCAVNPLIGREAELVNYLPAKPQKVVVIGGGPGGMQAARQAADKGHEVVLFEKESTLGGALKAASKAPFKKDMQKYLDWAILTTQQTPGLTVKLSTEAKKEEIVAEKPDALIIAAGAVPQVPRIPGIDKDKVVLAADVELGNARVGDWVVVAGAGLTGSETALNLAQSGKQVVLIDMMKLEQIDAEAVHISMTALRSLLQENKVETLDESVLQEITDHGIKVGLKNGETREIPCDTVVLALGMQPRKNVIDQFKDVVANVRIIGDANSQKGNLYQAVSEGFFAATDI
jgi:2,4-dienoyl-CoA reductase-like NADH-dependent reductase (Old Yellow Enzyme family)/thioredoxin reductase